MIGNDVVDLRDPETSPSTRHPRFDERVFAEEERDRIAAAADAERLRWTLWAAKEAAFKAAKRLDQGLVFTPRRFVVDLEHGVVVHETAGRFALDLTVRDDVVHAVARMEAIPAAAVITGFVASEDVRQSDSVRHFALARLAKSLGNLRGSIDASPGSRAPSLRTSGGGELPISLSHHGRFVAFAALGEVLG